MSIALLLMIKDEFNNAANIIKITVRIFPMKT